MRIAYLDCATGISGDMTLAALIDAGVDADRIRAGIDSLGLAGVRLITESVVKEGFRATYVRVEHPEQHAHRHLRDVVAIIDAAKAVSARQKELAKQIFQAVAAAEAKVHGSTVDKVHFHEVGAIDSIVDIVGAAIAFDLLGADEIVASPIPTGRGKVKIAHGQCSVPTPGTAELLKGIPLADVPIEAELTTPTGAAIVRTLVSRFGALPEMTIDAIGYGAGTANFPGCANLLRVVVGTSASKGESDEVILLETNLDDVTPEIVGYTKQRLFDHGALDVFSTAIQMKKNRPGVMLSVLAKPADADDLESILFSETNTFGIRRSRVLRSIRARQEHAVDTPWGSVRGKLGWRSGETPVFSPEFEACARIAQASGVPLREVYRAAEAAYLENPVLPGRLQSSPPRHEHSHDRGHHHDHSHDHRHDHDHDHHG